MSERIDLSVEKMLKSEVTNWIKQQYSETRPKTLVMCTGGQERSSWVAEWLFCRGLVDLTEINQKESIITAFSYYNLGNRDFRTVDLAILCVDFPRQKLMFTEVERKVLSVIPVHLYLSGSWDSFREIDRRCS